MTDFIHDEYDLSYSAINALKHGLACECGVSLLQGCKENYDRKHRHYYLSISLITQPRKTSSSNMSTKNHENLTHCFNILFTNCAQNTSKFRGNLYVVKFFILYYFNNYVETLKLFNHFTAVSFILPFHCNIFFYYHFTAVSFTLPFHCTIFFYYHFTAISSYIAISLQYLLIL